jgi:hypothetical protein
VKRNGTPPWPGVDDLDHEPCDHDVVRALLPLLTTGSVECAQCGRVVLVDDLTPLPTTSASPPTPGAAA